MATYACSLLENPIDRGAWWATVHSVTELDMTEHTSTHVIITVLFSQCLFIFAYIFITSIAFHSSHISHPFQASTCLGSLSTWKKESLSC